MSEQSYPILVDYTERHLVWVEADTPEIAAKWVAQAPWEYTEKSQSFDGWSSASQPRTESDWDDIYNGYNGAAEEPDHHVLLHQAEPNRRRFAAEKAACHEARHPNADVFGNGTIWCPGCCDYLYVAAQRDRTS